MMKRTGPYPNSKHLGLVMVGRIGRLLVSGLIAVAGCQQSTESPHAPTTTSPAATSTANPGGANPAAANPEEGETGAISSPPAPSATAAAADAARQPPQTTTSQPPKGPAKTKSTTKEFKLIPRKVLFGNPQKASARISPNGKWLSYLAPVEGILNVWVCPLGDLAAAKPVTHDKLRNIRGHRWAYTGQHILYTQDKEGDENWHVYATNVETGETKDLTPLENVHATIQDISQRQPKEILVGLNDRVPQLHDIYRVNIETGQREMIQENDGMVGYVTDEDFKVRFAIQFTPDANQVVLEAQPAAGKIGPKGITDWKEFLRTGPEDAMTTSPVGFDKSGQTLYLLDSRKRDTTALFAVDLNAGDQALKKARLLAEDPRADVDEVLIHPTKLTIQAVGVTYSRREWKILDETIRPDLDYLKTVEDGELIVTSRTLDDTQWTVAYILDNGPLKFYRYDRAGHKAHFLFSSRNDLDAYPLVKMRTPILTTRDGLKMVSYLTLPPGSDPDGDGQPEKPLPMVLDVHGGPWARDDWGYNPTAQWLANRGYAVLNVNYRGSTGFGKNFTNAADGQWAAKMHDDLIDAVQWAIKKGIAQADKVAIMGGSYGGYATLVGLTFTPKTFACGVDIVGPSSLVTLLENVPPYWIPLMPMMKKRIGDVASEAGKAELLKRSPLSRVDQIERPLLIGQGANDPRVTQLEADQIVKAMRAKKIPVTYVLYPDEGHGFAGEENRMSFNAVTEAFLGAHLGGRVEPIGNDFQGSSIQVPAGAEQVPGLAAALKKGE